MPDDHSEQKVGDYIIVYTRQLQDVSIAKEGLLGVREFVEEVKRLDGESEPDWLARAVNRAKEL